MGTTSTSLPIGRLLAASVLFCLFVSVQSFGQAGSSPLSVFGYFQNEFEHQDDKYFGQRNTFALQQLNLFFQKDLGKGLTSFVNVEAINNFSSSKRWGSLDLQEAWVRYKVGRRLNLKFGLQIPIFNNLNEIKNRTPLLPYVIRPLVYEASFSEIVALELYVPQRAFVQAYGFVPAGDLGKIDFAAYVGNSPNVNSHFDNEQGGDFRTGVDTTNTFLIGGRVGFRAGELKLGVSGTADRVNQFSGLTELFGGPPDAFENMRRLRAGGDLSFRINRFVAEGEVIRTGFRENTNLFDLNLTFVYGTLGYRIDEQWFVFASYWHSYEQAKVDQLGERAVLYVPNVGAAMNLSDSVTLKAHYAYVILREADSQVRRNTINFYSIAMSVIL